MSRWIVLFLVIFSVHRAEADSFWMDQLETKISGCSISIQ